MPKNFMASTSFLNSPVVPATAESPRPAYCTIEKWILISSMGRRSVYDALGRGELTAIKVGTRTLIDVEAGMAWLRSRPKAIIRAPRERHSVAA